ncbi:hypothetical protein QCA50_017866 [Cerrena zonata]|uniref:Translation initiation factor eIF2B subunit beta n=1 Tax=Cerrena zonata TaxID=2478898 RepID=A0AAW0FP91_9APHY
MSADLIHDNEILLTPTPTSDTLLQFLIRARSKRKFTVLVTENYPNDIKAAHIFAKKLCDHKIETIVIPDTTTFAVMSRVGKVILGTKSVFANGGCMANSGVANVVECAKEHKTPVLAVAGLYKLSPLYPFNRDDLIEVGNSGKVLDYSDSKLVDNVDVVTNPLDDYVSPEHIDIYITNIGGLAWVVLVSSNGAILSPQELFNLNIDKRERIAIIGAGAGGSSAAYYLQRFSPGKYDVTIFEKSDSVGGRSTTVDVKGHKVETFNLSTQKFGEKVKGTVAIWNGDRVVLELGSSWWSNIKLLINKFLQSYYDGNFPFANLTDLTVESKFSEVTHLTAEEYLYEQEISDDFANNLIQAATRVNYAQNLDQIHGIGSLVAVAADGAEQVKDGNWIIFDNFIKYSDAKLHLQTRVKSIMKNEEGWLVSYDDKTSYFDQVIIASPFGQSRINLQSGSGKKLSEHPVEFK